jgi:hypothetical protein
MMLPQKNYSAESEEWLESLREGIVLLCCFASRLPGKTGSLVQVLRELDLRLYILFIHGAGIGHAGVMNAAPTGIISLPENL